MFSHITDTEVTVCRCMEQLQNLQTELCTRINNGIYAQVTDLIQEIQHIRYGRKWKLHLGRRAVFRAIKDRQLCTLIGYIVQKNIEGLKTFFLQEDWLRTIRVTLEESKRKLIANAVDLQRLIDQQQRTILDLIEAWKKNGKNVIVVMAPYFTEERLADGYFQRVQAVDRMMPLGSLKIYVSWLDADQASDVPKVFVRDDEHIEIQYTHPNAANDERIHQIALKAGVVYHHSITFANEMVTRDEAIRKAFDMHGAYPEELRMYERSEQAEIDEAQERLAMEHGHCLICVTRSMIQHLKGKYGHVPKEVILLPIFDEHRLQQCRGLQKTVNEKPTVVYAGGIQKWQNVAMMQEAMRRTAGKVRYRFFTPDPHAFWKLWGVKLRPRDIEVCAKSPDEIVRAYADCDYGFLLRDDIAVNRVACPTKLVEYLAAGILPILYSPNVGDFVQDGMAYISIDDFLLGKLPSEDEKNRYIEQNIALVQRMEERYHHGKKALCQWIGQNGEREVENK